MVLRSRDEWRRISMDILLASGADNRNAERVSEALVTADLRGVHSHGLRLLPAYVQGIQGGEIAPTAWPEIREETPTTARVSGNWTFGQVGAKFAVDTAIAKASTSRVAVVGLVEAHHIGRLGEYSEMAAKQGMVSIVLSGGYGVEEALAVPHGGRQSLLSTNPMALGFPAGQGPPVILDCATTVIAGSKVAQARARNERVSPGTLVDSLGRPTTDPAALFQGGGLLPFGGHKGYGLMLFAELWGRILTGSDRFAAGPRGGSIYRHTGTTMVVFRGDLFQSLAECLAGTDTLQEQIHAVPPAAGFQEVLLPGDLEERAQQKQARHGIALPEDVLKQLADLRAELGLDPI